MKDFHDNYFRYWQWFVLNHQDELYTIIMSMMKDRIEELLPPLIEKYLLEYFKNFTVDIQTTLNGKQVNLSGLEDEIKELLFKEIKF